MSSQPKERPQRKTFLLRRLMVVAVLATLAGGLGLLIQQSGDGEGEPVATTTPREDGDPTEAGDETPPTLELEEPEQALAPFEPVRVAGEIDEPATIKIGPHREKVSAGRFSIRLPNPPRVVTSVVARDAAGNKSETELDFDIRWPPMRAVHVSAYAWATPSFRRNLMDMIRKRLINTIQLDLKDESGVVGYDSKIPLARRIRSSSAIYDLKDALRILHKKKVRVVGRIVCFRDPILAKASWPRHKDRVIQNPDGSPYANYGGFTNFANRTVRNYSIALAEEAAAAGIDDILYDYVRRPDGPLEKLKLPGLATSPEKAVVGFVAESKRRLAPYGTQLGLSVYGIAATRPREIAQDIPRMAKYADFISPMVYPSHWAAGEYNVGNPHAEPYKIVRRSLKDFIKQTRKTEASVIPWLQDFSLGITYGAAEVRAQIQATYDSGIKGWILWDPNVTYTVAALDPAKPEKND